MPTIENIDVALYDPNDPYHFHFDNIPFQNLITRQEAINRVVDKNSEILRGSIGSAGTLGNRLDRSLNQDGTLKSLSIDEALHSIEAHEDTDNFVRMSIAERDKLSLISDEATNVKVQITIDSLENVLFDEGIVEFTPSSSVTWSVDSLNKVQANLTFPSTSVHLHFYDLIPVPLDIDNPDNINYKINNTTSPSFIEGSLRIFINGVRLTESEEIYVPGRLVDDPWTLMSFSADPLAGTFTLTSALQDEDIIRIDFDMSFF